jgi:putative transposase
MLQSLMIRLETTEDNKARLSESMKRYNEACNFVAKRDYSLKLANKYKLHKEIYHETREIWFKQPVRCQDNRQSCRSI